MAKASRTARKTQSRSTRVVWKGRHVEMAVRGGWEFARRPGVTGIVGIVAVTDRGQLVLVEQYRPPLDARVIELPAGLSGDTAITRGENLSTAARRELLEETGYAARRLRRLCSGTSSSGICDEVLTLFLATGLSKRGPGGGDATEKIVVHEVPLARVESWLRRQAKRGVLVDLKVYAALAFCRKE
jgi:ADP-ribose pyrophosphatase